MGCGASAARPYPRVGKKVQHHDNANDPEQEATNAARVRIEFANLLQAAELEIVDGREQVLDSLCGYGSLEDFVAQVHDHAEFEAMGLKPAPAQKLAVFLEERNKELGEAPALAEAGRTAGQADRRADSTAPKVDCTDNLREEFARLLDEAELGIVAKKEKLLDRLVSLGYASIEDFVVEAHDLEDFKPLTPMQAQKLFVFLEGRGRHLEEAKVNAEVRSRYSAVQSAASTAGEADVAQIKMPEAAELIRGTINPANMGAMEDLKSRLRNVGLGHHVDFLIGDLGCESISDLECLRLKDLRMPAHDANILLNMIHRPVMAYGLEDTLDKTDPTNPEDPNAEKTRPALEELHMFLHDNGIEELSDLIIDELSRSMVSDVLAKSASGVGVANKLVENSVQLVSKEDEAATNLVEDLDLAAALRLVGILQQDEHLWTMRLPASEQYAVMDLAQRQSRAVKSVRDQAALNHKSALGPLRARCEKIGIGAAELWAMLSWVRDLAPIIVHVDVDAVGRFFETDTHYRNQFETFSSKGLLCSEKREDWERKLFGDCYDNAPPFERPKYGVVDVMNDHRGAFCARDYGDSYLVLKNVRLRCTCSPGDSGGIKQNRLAVLDHYAHLLTEFSDAELLEVARVACAEEGSADRIGNSEISEGFNYKEAQIHGEIDFKRHVKRLVVHPRHLVDGFSPERIHKVCDAHGWEFAWMQDEKKRRMYRERD